jgi:hypothetical protein
MTCNVPLLHKSFRHEACDVGEGDSYLVDLDYNNFVRLSEINFMRFPDHRCNLLDDRVAFEGVMIAYCRSNGILLRQSVGRLSNQEHSPNLTIP